MDKRSDLVHTRWKMRYMVEMRLNSGMMDSGLVVVVCIISCLIILTFSFLLFVDYEWCHVLFKNNTVISSNELFALP